MQAAGAAPWPARPRSRPAAQRAAGPVSAQRAARPVSAPRPARAGPAPSAAGARVGPSPPAGVLALSPARERARRHIVTLVFAIYLLVIFEGALRKWALPQLSQFIFFVRDPLLLLAYLLAWRHGLWPRGEILFGVSLAMAGLGVVVFVLQAASGGESDLRLVLGAYGWRAYFLYVPLAFLIGAVFGRADLLRLGRLTLILSVPIALLVTLQFFSPAGAAINVGSAADEALQFRGLGLDAEHTRPMGPFASGAGQQQFVATACALLLAYFVTPRGVAKPGLPLLAAGAGGVLTCLALSGSRGTVLQCALAVVFALAVGVLGRGGSVKGRALLWPLALTAGAVVLYPVLFPEGFTAFSNRWTHAQAAEARHFEAGIFGRALYGLVDFVRLVEQVPLLGYGLGFGGNAAVTLRASIDGVLVGFLAETDYARQMVDLGPIFGSAYIAYRVAFTGWLAALALRATRLSSDPLPMLLLSYVGYTVLQGQITGNGAINAYGWLFAGLLIAACKQARAPRAAAVAAPPFIRYRARTLT